MARVSSQWSRCVLSVRATLGLCTLLLLVVAIGEFAEQRLGLYNLLAMRSSSTQFDEDMATFRDTLSKKRNIGSSMYRVPVIPEKVNVDHTSVILKALRTAGNAKGVHTKIKDDGASPVFSELSAVGRFNHSLNAGLPELIDVDYIPVSIHPDMGAIQIQDAIITLSLQRQIICTNWEMYGLKTDGGWPVCKAKAVTPRTPCTVYSFGINNDWSFDDAYRERHGCTIRTFDPSMVTAKDHEHSLGVYFYKLGLSNTKRRPFLVGWNTDTFGGMLKHFNEDKITIPYLKFDIEGYEWGVLAQMLAEGVLKNVVQLSFEMHVYYLTQVKHYFEIIKGLEALGFRRWFYHHRLNGASYQCDQSFININFIQGYNERS